MKHIELPENYSSFDINSFRFHIRADFYKFTLDALLIDKLRERLLIFFKNSDWNSHNIFSLNDSAINEFKDILKTHLLSFCKAADIQINQPIYILGWLNCLKPNETIKTHFHSLETLNFFSCNVSLDEYDTSTSFYVPWIDRYGDILQVSNSKGQCCIFPSWLWHSVEKNKDVRYSLGIDFYTQERINDYFSREHDISPAPIQFAIKFIDSA